jgi:SnoaL-like domain
VTGYLAHLAEVWSEVWSSEESGTVARIYARDVVWWDVARGRGTESVGHDALTAARNTRLVHAHDTAVEVERLVSGDGWTAVEFLVFASERGRRVGAPGCAWWQLDDDGRIAREHVYFEWDRRRPVDGSIAGHTVRAADVAREPRWYRQFVQNVAETWDADPPAVVDRFYAPDVVFDTMGAGPEYVIRGADALRYAARYLAEQLVDRKSKIGEVAGSGPLVAFTHFTEACAHDGPRRTTPVARVLTIDAADRIVGDHTYLLRAWPARGRR